MNFGLLYVRLFYRTRKIRGTHNQGGVNRYFPNGFLSDSFSSKTWTRLPPFSRT